MGTIEIETISISLFNRYKNQNKNSL